MALANLDAVSPSLAWQLTSCSHAVGLQRSLPRMVPGARTQTTSAALGTAAHKVLEVALQDGPFDAELTREWFETTWFEAVESVRGTCVDQSPPERWRRFSIIKRGARRLVSELRSEVASNGAVPFVEAELVGMNGQLHGRPDIVMAFADGSATVIDFKTGDHSEDDPTDRELNQLDLYTVLVAEDRHLSVREIRVARCDGPSWAGVPDVARAQQAAQRGIAALVRFNDSLSDTIGLANPGEACTFCRQVLRCDVAWHSAEPRFVGVAGVVNAAYEDAGQMTLKIVDGDTQYVIVGCPTNPDLVGCEIRVAHVRDLGDGKYRWLAGRSLMASS